MLIHCLTLSNSLELTIHESLPLCHTVLESKNHYFAQSKIGNTQHTHTNTSAQVRMDDGQEIGKFSKHHQTSSALLQTEATICFRSAHEITQMWKINDLHGKLQWILKTNMSPPLKVPPWNADPNETIIFWTISL